MTAEQQALITAMRKQTEDLIHASVKSIFNGKFGEVALIAGTITVAFTGDLYSSVSEFEVDVFQATDANGVDISDAITIKDITTLGFKVESPRAGTLKWQSFLKTPKFNFWT